MALLDFLKMKKDKGNNAFIGRHQQLCEIKKFLGYEVPALERQIAANKDNSERNEIIKKLEKIEEYIESDMFTNIFDVESTNKDIRDLIDRGYKTCVLINDTELKNRCYKIFNNTSQYIKNSLDEESKTKSEEFVELSNQIKSLFELEKVLNLISLGGLLKDSSDEQRSWIIMNSLVYPNSLVKIASSLLPPEPALKETELLKAVADSLLKDSKITNRDLQKIISEIKEGLELSKKNYEHNDT